MTEPWSPVPESAAFAAAGTPADILRGDDVAYVLGPSATLVVVEAGDRPNGNGVQTSEWLCLHAPVPAAAARRLADEVPVLGYVRMPEGLVPLGRMTVAVRRLLPDGDLMSCDLIFDERLPLDVLDRVRPTAAQPLPGTGWLRLLPHDPIAAMREFVAGWYADIPPGDEPGDEPGDPARPLPEPLRAFYRVAAGRPAVHGQQNRIYPAADLRVDASGRLEFGAENQGVFVLLLDPPDAGADAAAGVDAAADPTVRYGGCDLGAEREPLSGFLLQFLLNEAALGGPFGGFETVTEAQLRQLLAPTHEVPLRPMRWPADPTRHHVAPGVVVAVADGGDGTYEVFAGSRQRSALRPFRPFFA